MACQDARPVYQSRISANQKAAFLQVQAVCRECKSRMFKNYKLADFSKLKRQFKLVDVSQLYDCANTTGKTHIPSQVESVTSETLQGDLFL